MPESADTRSWSGTFMSSSKKNAASVSLALYLAMGLAPGKTALVERASNLLKADLLTGMVGEFPGLQGVMGREYAIRSGEDYEVALAIEEHYMPVRAGGALPKTVVGSILSMADKVDTICAMFAIGLQPSGTQDPYALRRLALGVLSVIEDKVFFISLKALLTEALILVARHVKGKNFEIEQVLGEVLAFFQGRFVNNLTSSGIEADTVKAAVRAGFNDILDCLKRANAISKIRMQSGGIQFEKTLSQRVADTTEVTERQPSEFESLCTVFKRIMNILKGFHGGDINPSLLVEPQEKALFQAYAEIEPTVKGLLDNREYEAALYILLSLKPTVDSFFDHVMVMSEDEVIRTNRLSLLWWIAGLFLRVGDLSAISIK